MHVGAISVNADDAVCKDLERFGELLGLCFQIKDDIFDYYEDEQVGKPTGNDIREGKITLPLLYAITRNSGEENARMRMLLEKDVLDTEDIDALIGYAKDNGGIAYAQERMQQLRDEAADALKNFADNESKCALITLLDYTISRRK
jgi:octaprenyl-diphosphate synthase